MNSEFRAAKNTIRAAVAAAPRATVERALTLARLQEMPWSVCTTCLSGQLSGSGEWWGSGVRPDPYWETVSQAYRRLGQLDDAISFDYDDTRQRVLIPILRADLRRRDRAMVKALVESAVPVLVEAGL